MTAVRWHYSERHGRDVPQFGAAVHSYAAMCSAATRMIDARYAAAGRPPGSPEAVAHADARTAMDDRRIAWWIANHPERLPDLDRNGLACG